MTGEEKWSEDDFTKFGTWWWTDGNGSCDCNRQIVMGHGDYSDKCTSERYVIVEVDPMLPGYTLADFNRDYEGL